MVRLSDFVFPTANPPNVIESPIAADIAKIRIPGKLGNVKHHMGTDDMKFSVRGGLFNTTGDTDKHYTELYHDLMTLFISGKPMTFTHNSNSVFGEDGDSISEATTGWTDLNCTLATDGSVKKVGSNSLKITGLGGSDEVLRYALSSAINCNLPIYSTFCFWLRVPATSAANDITVRMRTSAGNFYSQTIDLSAWDGGLTANVWKEIIIPVGSAADDSDWSETGSPDWTDINDIDFWWLGAASDTVYMDGICLTNAVTFNGIPRIHHPPGKPHQINYRLELEQYSQ